MTSLPTIPLFPSGRLVATPGALALLEQTNKSPLEFLARHLRGDWGDLDQEDKAENELGLKHGFARYRYALTSHRHHHSSWDMTNKIGVVIQIRIPVRTILEGLGDPVLHSPRHGWLRGPGAFFTLVTSMIKLEQLQRGRVYRLQSRNLACGVWNGKDDFIGIRTKFGLRFLDMEIHWGLSKTFGTAQALEELGTIPDSISLKISVRTECGNGHEPLKYVKRHEEQAGASGEWLHDDGRPNCSVPALNDKAGKAGPVAISNDALFAELQKYDCDT